MRLTSSGDSCLTSYYNGPGREVSAPVRASGQETEPCRFAIGPLWKRARRPMHSPARRTTIGGHRNYKVDFQVAYGEGMAGESDFRKPRPAEASWWAMRTRRWKFGRDRPGTNDVSMSNASRTGPRDGIYRQLPEPQDNRLVDDSRDGNRPDAESAGSRTRTPSSSNGWRRWLPWIVAAGLVVVVWIRVTYEHQESDGSYTRLDFNGTGSVQLPPALGGAQPPTLPRKRQPSSRLPRTKRFKIASPRARQGP